MPLGLWHDLGVPDTRTQRGPHPKDRDCFAPHAVPTLQTATADLSWLLSRGYSARAASKLVGDRYSLRDRQRKALQRCAASDQDCALRSRNRVGAEALEGDIVAVDGYNVLLSLEAALCGGVLLLGRDGAMRDIAAMSRHYRRVHATVPAIQILADFFEEAGCTEILWYLDRPVSNSGRLKKLIEAAVAGRSTPWRVELIHHTDRTLAESPHIVATADSAILDRCGRWINLARTLISREVPDAWIVDLSGTGTAGEESSA
jgi:hypothetical protein